MSTTIDRDHRIAYVLDRDRLEQIVAFLSEWGPIKQILVRCSDGSSITFDSLEKLFAFPNPKDRAIQSITFYVNKFESKEDSLTIFLHFMSEGIRCSVSGEDRDALHISARADELISTFRTWYTRIAFADFLDLFFGTLLLFTIVIGVPVAIWALVLAARGRLEDGPDSAASTTAQAIGIVAVAILFLVGSTMNFAKRWMFPVAEFAVGAGIQRQQRSAFLRRLIGRWIAIPLAVTTAGGLLVALLTS